MRRLLTADEVRKARTLARQNIPIHIIADSFPGIPYNSVYRAIQGYTYIDITDPPPLGVPWQVEKKLAFDEGKKIKDLAGKCQRCEILCDGLYCDFCLEEDPSLTESVEMS